MSAAAQALPGTPDLSNGDGLPMIRDGRSQLLGFGELDWAAFRTLTEETTCSWGSPGGWRIGSCPQEPPSYSHLWASGPAMLLRARINGPRAMVGALIAPDADDTGWPGHLPTPASRGVVDVTVLSAYTATGFEELTGDRITLVRVVASSPVDFVVVRRRESRT